ncbi:MAG: L-serine ammonia-lyase, iron-sulfur-dependent, subunit alpha [Paludibacteraceae bacterium]|nr:L-serine ammonia-lyase, iron-sulfur-dependent, subunit alpha [Paludibacteraceae bacterium]
MKDTIYELIRKEVIPAIGCTEPIAVALCVARAKEKLGAEPTQIIVELSKNIYKNAMAVGIPNTGMTGLQIAIALGATIGKSEYMLEVLRDTNEAAVTYAKKYMEHTDIQIVVKMDAPDVLYIHTTVSTNNRHAQATIQGDHTHFVEQGEEQSPEDKKENAEPALTMRRVWDYAMNVDVNHMQFLLEGAKMNMAAAEKSFMGNYGHGLGRMLHKSNTADIFSKILAYTSGACDARMSGAMIPVMSNSGSGNQGISCSVPVYVYALENNIDEEKTLRALTLSNLTVIYIKQSLGRLSALCGCVVAATGSAVGLTYLMGGQFQEITYAIKNMIANISGMICDGAKPGCALKVTSGVSTAVLSAHLAMQHSYADASEGIVEEDIDRTIHNLTRIGHDGMTQTDDVILDIMTHKC